MSARHWFLAAGSLLALVVLVATTGGKVTRPALLLLFAGGLIGIWASEGVHAHAREQGIDLDPL